MVYSRMASPLLFGVLLDGEIAGIDVVERGVAELGVKLVDSELAEMFTLQFYVFGPEAVQVVFELSGDVLDVRADGDSTQPVFR